MQNDPGANSGNWLCNYVAELSTSFSILFSQRFTSSRQAGFLWAAAQLSRLQNQKNFSHVETIVVECVSKEWIALKCIRNEIFDNDFTGPFESAFKDETIAVYRLLISGLDPKL